MYYFTTDTITQANKNIEALDSKVGGLLCVLHCLVENIEENVSYTIDGENLRRQLSLVFDKEPKDSFGSAKSSYIIFARNWASTFFDNYIKNKVDLLSCAVFFLRRNGFERECTSEEVINIFIKRFNLQNYKDRWFYNSSKVKVTYNQNAVEDNQAEFYSKMNYTTGFKSILFSGVIQKSAADLKAAGQIQTLYSGSGIHTCLLLSDEPLDQYYIMNTSSQNCGSQFAAGTKSNEEAFKTWLMKAKKGNGETYTESTRTQYITALKAIASEFESEIAPYTSIFEVNSDIELPAIIQSIKDSAHYPEFNDSHGNGALSAGLTAYLRYLVELANTNVSEDLAPICLKTGYANPLPRNRIFFGAPGTGKSYTLNKEKDALIVDSDDYERVTFHPDYSYANFVGTYKPVPADNDVITYSYVPGPFMRTLVKALKNSRTDTPKPYLLMIEEINRANVAAVFGEVFQLLDRNDDEVSEYAIQASEDIKKYLASQLGGVPSNYDKIQIPDNMFIWATMNSADQGVFPMDTAFKRRWDFTYLGIDDSESGIAGKTVILGQGTNRCEVEWNELRKAINAELIKLKVNEDKLMGPYFLAKKSIMNGDDIDVAKFIRVFKNKVIMYLFDDAAKRAPNTLFGGCDATTAKQYSKICQAFDEKGIYIFGQTFGDEVGKMIEVPLEDDAT